MYDSPLAVVRNMSTSHAVVTLIFY